MLNSKIHDMFKLAMWDEHISCALYTSLVERVPEQAVKEKLLRLAADEKGHFETLRDMHGVLCCREAISVSDIAMPSQAQAFTGSNRPVDLEAFFVYAMEKEKSAQDFYVGMCEPLDSDKDACATLMHFSAMEADHLNLLRGELENLRRMKNK